MVLTMQPSLKTVGLSKFYGRKRALSDLNLEIPEGSIYGLIGPNGAGKTTALTILAGYLQATSGIASLYGQPVRPGSLNSSIPVGFASPQFPLPDYLTTKEVLYTCGRMHHLEGDALNTRMEYFLEMMDLQSSGNQFICHHSHGMRQKLSLACALIHDPKIVILDEPFLGLDPACIYRIIRFLIPLASEGRTIVVSSHDISLMERICNRVGILHEGILEKEIALSSDTNPALKGNAETRPWSVLETALWEIAGTPAFKAPTWLWQHGR